MKYPRLLTLFLLYLLVACSSSSNPPPLPPDVTPPPVVKTAIDETGPLRVEGRYFVRPNGQKQLLVGSHTGWEQHDGDRWEPTPGPFNFDRFLRDFASWGHNCMRMWTVQGTLYNLGEPGAKNHMSPLAWARTGPGKALDGGKKFNLLVPNPAFHSRLRNRMEQLRKRNIYGIVMLFQGVDLDDDIGPEYDMWKTYVWNPANNVQGYPLAKPGWQAHRATSGPIFEAQKVYMRDVVRTLRGLPNVLLEIANEDKNGSIEWQAALVSELRKIMDEELPHTPWPIGVTFRQGNGTNSELVAAGADWISPKAPRGINAFARWRPIGNLPNLLDTDHFWVYVQNGNTKQVDKRAHLLPEMAIEQGAAGLLHLDKPGVYLNRKGVKHQLDYQAMMPIRKAMGKAVQK